MSERFFQLTDIATLGAWEDYDSLAEASAALAEMLANHGEDIFSELAVLEYVDGKPVRSLEGSELLSLAEVGRRFRLLAQQRAVRVSGQISQAEPQSRGPVVPEPEVADERVRLKVA